MQQETYYRKTRWVLWGILFANLLVAAVKLFLGTAAGCASLTADGTHSLADGTSNIIGLVGLGIAAQPRDTRHPYGHQKFEVLASLAIGIMLALLCAQIVWRGISAILSPTQISFTPLELGAIAGTIVINILVSCTEYRAGKRWNSTVLIADSVHTRSDIAISTGVLLSLLGMGLGLPPQTDGIVSLLVACVVAFSCLEILKPALAALADSSVVDCLEVKDAVAAFPQVQGVHKIRSRGAGRQIYIDMHILMEGDSTVEQAHQLSHQIEARLREKYGPMTETVLHIEPAEDMAGHSDRGSFRC